MKKGIKDVLYSVRWHFIPYLLVLCGCFVIGLIYTKPQIFFAVNALNWPAGDILAQFFTDLGYGWVTVVIAAILALYSYREAFLLATSYALTSILAQVVKHIFDHPRPKLYFQGHLTGVHFVKGVEILGLHSFPSGHTVTAFSTTFVIAYFAKKKGWGVPLLVLAMLIGYSRMYLSEHFFEDVVAGSVIGVFATVIWLWYMDNKRFLHTPAWNKGLLKR